MYSIALSDIDFLFALGDSYTANDWDSKRRNYSDPVVPTHHTSTGGLSWIEYIAQEAQAPLFDLAAFGATTDNAIVWFDTVPSFADQVNTFKKYFPLSNNPAVEWIPRSTFVAIWFGINDIGFAWCDGLDFSAIVGKIFESYDASLEKLYKEGLRNFIILTVPPSDLSPGVTALGPEIQAHWGQNIILWNMMLAIYVEELTKKYPQISVTFFDANAFLQPVFVDPSAFGMANTTDACPEYALFQNYPSIDLPQCGVPLGQYYWYDQYHESWAITKLVAEGVEARLLQTVFNVRRKRTLRDRLATCFA